MLTTLFPPNSPRSTRDVRPQIAVFTSGRNSWFRDERSEDPAAWWPSRRARATTGRVMLGGTTTYALVAVEKGRVVADKQKATPDAFALAEGLKKLGLDFDVEVRAQSTKPGFFGSKHHYRQLDPPGQERVRTRVST